jgi:hypothetical protein
MYYVYSQILNPHVSATDAELMHLLAFSMKDAQTLTAAQCDAIRKEHADARDLYSAVTSGTL